MNGLDRIVELIRQLEVPEKLARDLLMYYSQIVTDVRRKNLEKSSTGKFVETIVQILQALDPLRQAYDSSVKGVENELNKVYESRSVTNIPDESRVPIVRIARAMYCLRSKRGMVHKNTVDPNLYDLRFALHSGKWILTEFVRIATQMPLEDALAVIDDIQSPVYPLVEEILGRPLVLNDNLTTAKEALVILYNEYPKDGTVSRSFLGRALDRRSPSAVTKALARLHEKRLIEGNSRIGYRLTALGAEEVRGILLQLAQ
jgi:hypothetical protein